MRQGLRLSLGFLVGLAGATGASLPGCSKQAAPSTELLLIVESAIPIDEMRVRAMTRGEEKDYFRHTVVGRDLEAEPLTVLIRPADDSVDALQLYAIGDVDQVCRAGAAAVVDFEPRKRVEVVLSLNPDYCAHDQDGDGYLACSHIGCDCDDRNPHVSPFMLERCDDRIDNNCSGIPINEHCPCRDEDPPVACTGLGTDFLHLAGIGECFLGSVACVDGTLEETCDFGTYRDEIAGNYRDDDCDGSVDEGSSCVSGTTRPCHRGFVDDPDNPEEQTRTAASDLALGDCRNPATDLPYGVQTCLPPGRWGQCENDRRPQLNPVTRVGWIELPPMPSLSHPGQCDGLDNDCDGEYDNEPYFDADGDGFTYCGTCPEEPDAPKLCDHAVDCDDSESSINPGQTEICGNAIDEDCRCDHDPDDRPVEDSYSVLGLPRSPTTGGAVCSPELAALSCANPVRSDETPIGSCADEPGPYYHGYFGPTATDRDCYYCPKSYGELCAQQTGACMTKDAACDGCDAPAPDIGDSAHLAEGRPLCKIPAESGCTGTHPAVWQDLDGEDPNDECGAVSCAGYYYGVVSHRCFARADQAADEVTCRLDGACQGAADLCVLETDPAPTPVALPDICVKVGSGCVGTLAPVYVEQTNGEDLFSDCQQAFSCTTSDSANGGGPFYAEARDDTGDGRDNPVCLLRQDVADSSCNGHGACQSRAEACQSAPAGAADPERPTCMRASTTSGCQGTDPPQYLYVASGLDPYGDCPDGTVRPGTCDGAGRCHRQLGEPCNTTDSLCEQGLQCVDSVCCDDPGACRDPCYGCSGALTGQADGHCAPILYGEIDDAALEPCVDEQGCGPNAISCRCDGTGACMRDTGSSCPDGADTCLTSLCVDGFCCESACDGVCTACARNLTLPLDGDPDTQNGQCRLIRYGLPDDSHGGLCTDSVDCGGTGGCACDAQGACLLDRDEACTADGQCVTGFCVGGTCCSTKDDDRDGHVDTHCGGDDCDDNSQFTYPGAATADDTAVCMKDADGDDYGDTNPPPGVTAGTDCLDSNAAVRPGVAEVCDGFDTDCDTLGQADATEVDDDSDEYVECLSFVDNGAGPTGGGDCDDNDSTTFPGAAPNDDATACMKDADDDQFGDAAPAVAGVIEGTDCNDTAFSVRPGVTDHVDDGVDQDCDGAELCYVDADGDGHRLDTITTVASTDLDCSDAGEGQAVDPADDCDDANSFVYPGATEVCDGYDTDCGSGGAVGATETDGDGDGYLPCTGYVEHGRGLSGGGDCDDAVATVYPSAHEVVADGVDQDCDTRELCYVDADGDHYRPDSSSTVESINLVCNNPGEAEATDFVGDCDDDPNGCGNACNEGIPAESNCADGYDNDCDGLTDSADTADCP